MGPLAQSQYGPSISPELNPLETSSRRLASILDSPNDAGVLYQTPVSPLVKGVPGGE